MTWDVRLWLFIHQKNDGLVTRPSFFWYDTNLWKKKSKKKKKIFRKKFKKRKLISKTLTCENKLKKKQLNCQAIRDPLAWYNSPTKAPIELMQTSVSCMKHVLSDDTAGWVLHEMYTCIHSYIVILMPDPTAEMKCIATSSAYNVYKRKDMKDSWLTLSERNRGHQNEVLRLIAQCHLIKGRQQVENGVISFSLILLYM